MLKKEVRVFGVFCFKPANLKLHCIGLVYLQKRYGFLLYAAFKSASVKSYLYMEFFGVRSSISPSMAWWTTRMMKTTSQSRRRRDCARLKPSRSTCRSVSRTTRLTAGLCCCVRGGCQSCFMVSMRFRNKGGDSVKFRPHR